MEPDNLQHQRLELKYIIPEQIALSVRDYVCHHLVLDKFGEGKPDFSYPVHSLYLDSDRLTLYWHTINGNKNRYKLRLRYYNEDPETPVFFEIKRRMNEAILKQRGGVKRFAAEKMLAGHLPAHDEMYSTDLKQISALENFCRLMQHHEAKPKAHVFYRREAWVSQHNNSVRVTMDRDVHLDPDPTTDMRLALKNPVTVFSKNSVVLELKFTGRFPAWFGDLTRHFNLWKCSAAKYADGVTLLRESGFNFGAGLGSDQVDMPETFQAAENLEARRANLKRLRERSDLALV